MDIPESRIIEAKKGLGKAILPETFLVSLYHSKAPYRGCGHGCCYCDGRAEKYFVEGDFQRDIIVRKNLPDLVAAEVAGGFTSREAGAIGIGSGVTDIYQPLEKQLCLTRRMLESLVPAGLPVVILTKSDLVLRDFDILARFPRALVVVTVTTVDPDKARILEPCASPPKRRLEVVRKAKEAGFFTGVMAMPFCPGITTGQEETAALFSAARDAGADFVYPGGVTLRPGRQKDFFISHVIDSHYPELRELYDNLYRENRQSGAPLAGPSANLAREWDRSLISARMSQLIPHRIYRELVSPPDSLFVLFCHMQTLYAARGVDTRPLRSATDRYAAWLSEERTALRRKRIKVVSSDPFPLTRILTEKLADLCGGSIRVNGDKGAPPSGNDPDGLSRLLGNEKLARLAAGIIAGGACFDYSTLAPVS